MVVGVQDDWQHPNPYHGSSPDLGQDPSPDVGYYETLVEYLFHQKQPLCQLGCSLINGNVLQELQPYWDHY